MRNLTRAAGLFLTLWIGSGALASSQPPQRLPNPEEGVIDGRGALMAVPISIGGGSPRQLDPKGLEVHLKPVDDPNVELVYPAGTWVLPPSGRYLYWLQGGGRMTPYAGLFGYSGNVAAGMTVSAALGEAGRVALSPQAEAGPDTVLELLHAGSYTEAGFLRWELLRRKPLDELGEGMLMPAGPTIGALWNRSSQRYEALSLPFNVPGRQAVEVPLQRPQGVAQLVAQLRRHETANTRAEGNVRLVLKREGKEVPPDARALTATKIFAYWYQLPPGPAELRAEANDMVFESPKLTLEAGRIENVTGQLKPYPALKVQLDLPAALREEKLTLEVRRLPSEEAVARQDLKKDAHSPHFEHHFEKVPPAPLAVDLKTPFGVFTREVDLSSGENGSVLLDPELITLRGTVYRGDKETPAKLTFTTVARKPAETEADEEGLYEIVVLQPLRMVSIELPGVKSAPYIDFFTRPVAESQEMDFHLSDAEVRVKVSDAATGRPIPKASLAVRNNYVVLDNEQDPPKEKEKAVFQSVLTDKDGLAWLPPLRKGSIEVRATAAGYLPPREPLKAGIADETTDQEFEIRLDPAGEGAALRLRLPGGEPAANAEVLLIDSLATMNSLFSGRADADGLVEPPGALAGVLLVKHPKAAWLIREWQAPEGGDEIEWTLPPAAERPLTVRVLDSTGRSPAPRVSLALTIEGRRLFDRVLSWLTGAPPMTDANGYWTGKNLPRAPLFVLAWGPELQREAVAGMLDAHATGVEVPWPEPVEVRAVE